VSEAVLCAYPEVVEEPERHGAQPSKLNFLLSAIRGGSVEMVRYLADCGAPLNLPSGEEFCWTALHEAAYSGNDYIVAFLLERGVDRDKSTPLEEAENSGRGAAADLIRNTLKCQQAWCLGL
jgi:ankyrin repeat protein